MSLRSILLVTLVTISATLYGQTSTSDGDWDTGSIWSTGSSPSTGWSTINVNTTVTLDDDWTVSGVLNVNADGVLTISGDVTVSGGSTLNVYGTLIITGSLTLNSNLYIYPGGEVIVYNDVNVYSSSYLNVGTSASPPEYADLVVKGSVYSYNSGDIIVNTNGRVAIYGSIVASGGGTFLRIYDGGQVYVQDDITISGGGSSVDNQNTSYIGLYVDGDVDVSGGGSSISGGENETGGYADSDYMSDENKDFYDWIEGLTESTLPVSLISFTASVENSSVVLSWSTASEKDNDYFTIKRSYDGEDYEELTTVSGQGDSKDEVAYEWVDETYSYQQAYYQLSQTDYDGTTEVLKTVVVSPEEVDISEVTIGPNPVQASAQIRVFNVSATGATFKLLSMDGRASKVGTVDSSNRISVLGLSPGIYILRIEFYGSQYQSRVIIQ